MLITELRQTVVRFHCVRNNPCSRLNEPCGLWQEYSTAFVTHLHVKPQVCRSLVNSEKYNGLWCHTSSFVVFPSFVSIQRLAAAVTPSYSYCQFIKFVHLSTMSTVPCNVLVLLLVSSSVFYCWYTGGSPSDLPGRRDRWRNMCRYIICRKAFSWSTRHFPAFCSWSGWIVCQMLNKGLTDQFGGRLVVNVAW